MPRKYLPLSGGIEVKAFDAAVAVGHALRYKAARVACRAAESLSYNRRFTYAGHTGEQPDSRMRNAAYARGYLLTHRARQVRLRDFEEFDRIVAMDDTNYHNLYRLAPSREAGNRIYRMSEFFREHPKWTHVPDPYYEGHEGFELVLDMLEDGCRTLLDELEKR